MLSLQEGATTSSEWQTARCLPPHLITQSPANRQTEREVCEREQVKEWLFAPSLSLSVLHTHFQVWLSLFGHDENGRLLGLIRRGMLLREETLLWSRCSIQKTVPLSAPYVIQHPLRHLRRPFFPVTSVSLRVTERRRGGSRDWNVLTHSRWACPFRPRSPSCAHFFYLSVYSCCFYFISIQRCHHKYISELFSLEERSSFGNVYRGVWNIPNKPRNWSC